MSSDRVMHPDEKQELLDLATLVFRRLRAKMPEEAAVRVLFNTIVFGQEESPRPLTAEQALRVRKVHDELRRLLVHH